ncbi:hypothetical protein JW777_09320 [bacterium]|nr:hypothetical protein [bacterium]
MSLVPRSRTAGNFNADQISGSFDDEMINLLWTGPLNRLIETTGSPPCTIRLLYTGGFFQDKGGSGTLSFDGPSIQSLADHRIRTYFSIQRQMHLDRDGSGGSYLSTSFNT